MTVPTTLGRGKMLVRVDEVFLAGTTQNGPALVGGISLVADDQGLTVVGPKPSSVRTMPWGRASTIACRQPTQLPDGRQAVLLELSIDALVLRFFVPVDHLGPDGAVGLEERLGGLARIPVVIPQPAVAQVPGQPSAGQPSAGQPSPGQPNTPTPSSHAAAPAPAPAQARATPSVEPLRDRGSMAPVGQGTVMYVSGGVMSPAGGGVPAGYTDPNYAPAAGGTLQSPNGPGQYVHVGKRHPGRGKKVVIVLVVLLAMGGGAGYYFHTKKASSSGLSSQDSLIASKVNLQPSELPGWKGVTGTVAGALGASAYGAANAATAVRGTGPSSAATSFASCEKISPSESDGALELLGFSDGLTGVESAGTTGVDGQVSSLLFEDPTATATTADSDVTVFGSEASASDALTAISGAAFAACFTRYLDAVIPTLVGGVMTGIPFAGAIVVRPKLEAASPGIIALGFSAILVRSGKARGAALTENMTIVQKGSVAAMVETVSPHAFPQPAGTRLVTEVEQNLAGAS